MGPRVGTPLRELRIDGRCRGRGFPNASNELGRGVKAGVGGVLGHCCVGILPHVWRGIFVWGGAPKPPFVPNQVCMGFLQFSGVFRTSDFFPPSADIPHIDIMELWNHRRDHQPKAEHVENADTSLLDFFW